MALPPRRQQEMTDTDRDMQFLRLMWRIRLFEERLDQTFSRGFLDGTSHLAAGQEACAVGATAALNDGDQVVSNHRGHGHLIAKGGDVRRMMAELMGKRDGYCGGRGGSQHMSAPEIGFLGTNGITGGGIPLATGAALSAQMLGAKRAVVCFFGDGATSQGSFHEALNIASLWQLPVLYVCENNGYAMSTPVARTVAGGDLLRRAQAYALRTERVDGMDVDAVATEAAELLQYVRAGKGPAFLEAVTYRYCGHSKSDRLVYRTRAEEAAWRRRDPVTLLRSRLDDAGRSGEADAVESGVAAVLAEAERRCADSPPAAPADAAKGVYADG